MLRPLRRAMEHWAPTTASGDGIADIVCVWPRIVGEDVALHCRPVQIVGQALVVATASSAWSHQLDLLSPRILTAIDQYAGIRVERLRFRVAPPGAPPEPRASPRPPDAVRAVLRAPPRREVAQTPAEALASLRQGILAAQRAKRAAGWKECANCRVLLPAGDGPLCAPCAGAARERRYSRVSRVMFDAPWLGYEGTARLIEGLQRHEFAQIRRRVLQGWWEILMRAQRRQQVSPDARELLVASSYVLLKTGFEPEEITTVIVRNLLGADLHELLYGKRGTQIHR